MRLALNLNYLILQLVVAKPDVYKRQVLGWLICVVTICIHVVMRSFKFSLANMILKLIRDVFNLIRKPSLVRKNTYKTIRQQSLTLLKQFFPQYSYLVASTGVRGSESTHSCTVTGDLLRGVFDGEGVCSKLPPSPSVSIPSIITLGTTNGRSCLLYTSRCV